MPASLEAALGTALPPAAAGPRGRLSLRPLADALEAFSVRAILLQEAEVSVDA